MLTYTFVIPSSKQKHTTGSLTHTSHTHDQQQLQLEQKATGRVTFGHFTGTEAPFVCEIPTASSNKKREFCWLAVVPQTDPTKACFKRSRWFGKRHKTDAFTKLGNLLSELRVPHKQCLIGISDAFSASFTSIWPSFPRFYCTLKQSVPTLRYTRRHLPSAVPWISEDRLLKPIYTHSPIFRTHKRFCPYC